MVMHHHETEHLSKRLVCYFQGQGHSKGSYDQNVKVSTILAELLILLLPNLVSYAEIGLLCAWSRSVAKGQNVNECLPRQYGLNG